MGHSVNYGTYEENVNKKKVQKEWDEYAANEDWQEGCSGLPNNIRWIDYVCDSYEDAEKYIDDHDNGWYDQLAVKYRETVKPKTKGYQNLIEKRNTIYKTLEEKRNRIHYSSENTKSEFVGCKHCGSRLATKYIKSNTCPVCGTELRPVSTLNAIKTLEKSLKEINKKIKEMEVKASKKAKIKWFVKVEFHV